MTLTGIRHDDGSCTFYGHEISPYGKENNRVDYGTLASCFECILNNYVFNETGGWESWEQESGFIDNSDEIEELEEELEEKQERLGELHELVNEFDDDSAKTQLEIEELEEQIEELIDHIEELEDEENGYYDEVYQQYIVDAAGAEILEKVNQTVLYNEDLDMYLWNIYHFGTSWTYVLTDIPIVTADEFYGQF